jgi:hypothetical protein
MTSDLHPLPAKHIVCQRLDERVPARISRLDDWSQRRSNCRALDVGSVHLPQEKT